MSEMLKIKMKQILEARKIFGNKWFILQVIGILIGLIMSPISMAIVMIVTTRKVLNGTARVFHNATVDGCKVGWTTIGARLLIGEPFVVQTAEGPVAIIHGAPDGRVLVDPNTHWLVNIESIYCAEAFKNLKGKVHLVSCYNGLRGDWGDSISQFVRVDVTRKPYPSMGLSCPLFGGIVIIMCEKWCNYLV